MRQSYLMKLSYYMKIKTFTILAAPIKGSARMMSAYMLSALMASTSVMSIAIAKADQKAAATEIGIASEGVAAAEDKQLKGLNIIPDGMPKIEAADHEDEYGETNPQEFSMGYLIKHMDSKLKEGKSFVCSLGYLATKSGRHVDALKIFKTCADHGNQHSKIWMSYMHQNGFGVKKDAKESTRWVEDAAKDGYSIGKYNYGLALIKGYGVKRDLTAGKALIDEVASEGDIHAIELKENGYNPDVVTPDADQNDTKPLF